MSNLVFLATGFGEFGRAGGWAGPWWVIFPLLWIAVIATVIWLVARKRGRSSFADRPLEILAARYARGEIDADEYRTRHDEIRGVS
jgi:putative membrane protein